MFFLASKFFENFTELVLKNSIQPPGTELNYVEI